MWENDCGKMIACIAMSLRSLRLSVLCLLSIGNTFLASVRNMVASCVFGFCSVLASNFMSVPIAYPFSNVLNGTRILVAGW